MNYKMILMLSADTPEQSRSTDVDKVMLATYEQYCFQGSKDYILSHRLQERSREIDSFPFPLLIIKKTYNPIAFTKKLYVFQL
ncbi:hypothetical protein KY492_20665 [Brevibacterium sp. PAMC21349]|nr:hypothetical protein KY492_20665 [Brevibacterium sp. PAMC21349]